MKDSYSNPIKFLILLLILWFVWSIHTILTPFILSAILAYILSPLVRILTDKLGFNRTVATIVVYLLVVSLIVVASIKTGILLTKESRELGRELSSLRRLSYQTLSDYPDFLRVVIVDFVESREIGSLLTPGKLWPYFSGAISGIATTFIFLVSGFYFLKDGHLFIKKLMEKLPAKYKKNSQGLIDKVNSVLNDYLRGQILLVLLMATVSWLILTFLRVKYALILGIFTGIAETIPFIGPIIAGAAAVAVAIFDGVNTLNLPPLLQGAAVVIIYTILRQMEDVFVIPYVLGKATNLHPLAVLFLVLVGGHFWGVLGMILAVPFAALLRTLLEYYLEYSQK